jgi:ABC-type transport system substrate-binding protein
MDALLAQQQNSVNSKVRATAVKKALLLAARRVPYIPLWYQDVAMGVNKKLAYKGFGTWYLYTPWALNISPR